MHLIKLIYYSLVQDLMPITNKSRVLGMCIINISLKILYGPGNSTWFNYSQILRDSKSTDANKKLRKFCEFLSFLLFFFQ